MHFDPVRPKAVHGLIVLISLAALMIPAHAERRHVQTESILVAPNPEPDAPEPEDAEEVVAEAGADVVAEKGTWDPFENVNRTIWRFNYDYVDHYVYRPTTMGYIRVTSPGFRGSVQNFVNNLREPRNTVNHLLTLEWYSAMGSLARFIGNTTVGIFGFFDVMEDVGVEYQNKDFDMVLGTWGINHGPFVMLPFYGPTTVRDFSGIIVDSFQYPFVNFTWFEIFAFWGLDSLYKREQLIAQEPLIDNAFDDYIFVREVFMQFQENRIAPLSPAAESAEDEALEDFLDELD